MPQAESRTYVTTTTNRWAVAFLNDAATLGYDAKIDCLKLLLEQNPPSKSKLSKSKLSKSKLNTQLQQNHDINKRQANSIIAYVEGAVKSANECRSNHLELLQGKLKHTTEVIGKLEKKIKAHRIGWAMTDKDGNLDGFGQFKVNIQSQPKGRTEAILVDVITQLANFALEHKRPIIVEKLNFSDKKKRLRELNARHNRMLSNFAYSKFLQLLLARCFKLGIQVIEVNPAYSSWIGLIKFMSMYGMNSATAAAFVLARRGMFLSERLPARTAYQGTEPPKHVWTHWRLVAKRVKGSSRHSFYQPRLTVYSRSRSARSGESRDEPPSTVVNSSVGAWRSR
jgi:IS605 OrfB family transposase